MTNPYIGLPPENYWRTAVAQSTTPVPKKLYSKKWEIKHDDKIATAGSCFAQHIGQRLKQSGFSLLDAEPAPAPHVLDVNVQKRFGYSTYSARYGNIYTTRQLLQLARETFGEFIPHDIVWQGQNCNYYDALRPNVEPDGLESPEEVAAHRKYHLSRVRELFERMDVFIFTMGLTEAWEHGSKGTVYPTAPGVIAGEYNPQEYIFKNYTADEVYADFLAFRNLILKTRANGNMPKFLLTVSPVPLTATASDKHVLVATMHSKSILRAVAGTLANLFPDIDYFPSFEIICNPWGHELFYEKNLRSVTKQGVDAVMCEFFKEHALKNGAPPQSLKLASQEMIEDNVICEEAILEAFADEGGKR